MGQAIISSLNLGSPQDSPVQRQQEGEAVKKETEIASTTSMEQMLSKRFAEYMKRQHGILLYLSEIVAEKKAT